MDKLKVILLVILSLALLGEERPEMDSAIDEVLAGIKMTRNDVSVQSLLKLDSFRLRIVDSLLADPISIYKIAENEGDRFLATENPLEDFNIMISYLGIEPSEPVFQKPEGGNPWSDVREIPPSLRNDMDLVYLVYQQAAENYRSAFADVDTFQLDTLYQESVNYLKSGARKLDNEIDEATLESSFLAELVREKMDERFFAMAATIDDEEMAYMGSLVLSAALRTYNTAIEIGSNIDGHKFLFAPDSMITGDVLYYTETEFGAFAIGGPGQTFYHGDFAFIVDLGGDDRYYGTAGGTGIEGGFSIAIDVAGNDIYISDKSFAFGAAHHGVGILIDHEGNDFYKAPEFSNGCGVFGFGLLWDIDGDDQYEGEIVNSGAGFLGTGILRDENGNDCYLARMYSQGFGYVKGFGALLDKSGNDQYIASGSTVDKLRYSDHYLTLSQGFGYGHRPAYSGGIGILADAEGNDTYVSDIFGQGSSYWYALGILYDKAGNDTYTAYQYAQGSATHISAAALMDTDGNDNFTAHSVSQGCGHDLAVGALCNFGNDDDNYIIWDLSQGAGNANGIGIFIEEGGNDSYIARKNYNIQGYGNWRREFGSIGLFVDMAGEDSYTGKGSQNSVWTNGRYGIGIDFKKEIE